MIFSYSAITIASCLHPCFYGCSGEAKNVWVTYCFDKRLGGLCVIRMTSCMAFGSPYSASPGSTH